MGMSLNGFKSQCELRDIGCGYYIR